MFICNDCPDYVECKLKGNKDICKAGESYQKAFEAGLEGKEEPRKINRIKWTGENLKEILDFCEDTYIDTDNYTLKIGNETVNRGEYIVKNNDETFQIKTR